VHSANGSQDTCSLAASEVRTMADMRHALRAARKAKAIADAAAFDGDAIIQMWKTAEQQMDDAYRFDPDAPLLSDHRPTQQPLSQAESRNAAATHRRSAQVVSMDSARLAMGKLAGERLLDSQRRRRAAAGLKKTA
jgi:hypothetical protein